MSRDALKDVPVNDRAQRKHGRILNGQLEHPSIQHVPIFLSGIQRRGRLNEGTAYIVEAMERRYWQPRSDPVLVVLSGDDDWSVVFAFLTKSIPHREAAGETQAGRIEISRSMADR